MSEDVLELIVPEGMTGDGERLRSAITLARLLTTEGRRPRADSTELDLARAGRELAECVRADTLGVLGQLFCLHLVDRPGLGPWQRPKAKAKDLWRGILRLDERKLGIALPSLPDPGESRQDVAQRILAAALCLGLSDCEANNWRGHLAFTEQDPLRAEAFYRKAHGAESCSFEERATAIAGVAGCLLDRGVVFLARDWMDRHLDLAGACTKLARLAGLASLATGDLGCAEQLLGPGPLEDLPVVIASFGDRNPELRKLLGGAKAWSSRSPVPAATPRRLSRSDYGASALVIMAGPPSADPLPIKCDLAPALGQPSPAWLDRQAAAPWTQGEPEQQLLSGGELFVGLTHGEDGQRLLRSCLSGTAQAVALVPVTREHGGELLGWVRLEFEHRLVPDAGRLGALGRGARRLFGGSPKARAPLDELRSSFAGVFEAHLGGIPLGRRRWWGVVNMDGVASIVASAGDVLGDWEQNTGGCGVLGRATKLGALLQGPMAYAGSEQGLHADGAAGVVLPLTTSGGHGVPCGWLVMEASRGGDLGKRLIAELTERCLGLGPQVGLARFSHWHQRSHGQAVHFSTQGHAPLPRELRADTLGQDAVPEPGLCAFRQLGLRGALVSGEPTLIVASPGAGKTIAGRFVLFERGFEKIETVDLRGMDSADLRSAVQGRGDSGLILRDLEQLEPSALETFTQLLGEGDGGRFVVTSRHPLSEAVLGARLVATLNRNRVLLPDLAQRRAMILPSFQLLLARAARCERRIAPTLSPEAAALLWRGDWPGGIRELANFAHQVVVFHSSDFLDREDLEKLTRSHGIELPKRLSSKRLDRIAFWSAIESTRKKCGAIHRGHAAGLMGWDPDTLSGKLKALGLGGL